MFACTLRAAFKLSPVSGVRTSLHIGNNTKDDSSLTASCRARIAPTVAFFVLAHGPDFRLALSTGRKTIYKFMFIRQKTH